ncbi:MAG: class I SAM-dependent methyltransferase [Chloroflexi bacterium]|nr:class I SAM-dependent methyltransferase [Chloroflexota bacterium]
MGLQTTNQPPTTGDYGPAGNYYDKFAAGNPLVRWMMNGFKTSLLELLAPLAYERVLEAGCGEGYILELLNRPGCVGMDIDLPVTQEARARFPAAYFAVADGTRLPVPDRSYDLVLGIEVLEHVPDPAAFVREARRVTRRYCLFSVPREPIWRVLNLARGRYWIAWGNTPGHIQHWSSAGFVRLLSEHLTVRAVRRPLPWTMVLCEVDGD